MAIQQAIELENGTTYVFEFTNESARKYELMQGEIQGGLNKIMTNMLTYIKTCLKDEPAMSNSKAEKIYDAIAAEYDIIDVYGMLSLKHTEVFTGGEDAPPKKKLSKM